MPEFEPSTSVSRNRHSNLMTNMLSVYIYIYISVGNVQIAFKHSLKNVGFTLDCDLTTNQHVSNILRTCFFELRRLASISRFLTIMATLTLVSASVLSRNDYCNSISNGSSHDVISHLQLMQLE